VMVIIQLAVPSAAGTNAGHLAPQNEPAQQNLRAWTRARKLFSQERKSFCGSKVCINY